MVKKWVTVQSCNLGIQATEEAKATRAQTTRNLPSRGKQRGGSGQSTTQAKLQANRGNEERSQEAAEDREREDTHALEGRDLLKTPRSPAAMLRQCEMD